MFALLLQLCAHNLPSASAHICECYYTHCSNIYCYYCKRTPCLRHLRRIHGRATAKVLISATLRSAVRIFTVLLSPFFCVCVYFVIYLVAFLLIFYKWMFLHLYALCLPFCGSSVCIYCFYAIIRIYGWSFCCESDDVIILVLEKLSFLSLNCASETLYNFHWPYVDLGINICVCYCPNSENKIKKLM